MRGLRAATEQETHAQLSGADLIVLEGHHSLKTAQDAAQQHMQNCTAARTLTRVPVDAAGGESAVARLVHSPA